jgi:CBS domain-containing protein
MKVSECCSQIVVVASATSGIQKAAQLMRENHVGNVVVVDESGGGVRPIGIVTDRDLVVEILASGAPIEGLTLGDVMSDQLLAVDEDEDIAETLNRMRNAGVRRAPVVDAAGHLVGILTLDDLLSITAQTLNSMAQLVRREIATEAGLRQ